MGDTKNKFEGRSLPDGCFIGKWSGFNCTVVFRGTRYTIKTSIGVKGIDIPSAVLVNGDNIEVSVITNRNEL